MDFVPLIDIIGEAETGVLVGLMLGTLFGALALHSGFCTRSAVLDITRADRGYQALALWLLAFATAIGGSQALVAFGLFEPTGSRFLSSTQSLSGAAIGGCLFGIGMVLARGCASRLLILGAGGNLRAVFTVAVIAISAWATMQGTLAPLRDAIAGQATTAALNDNVLGHPLAGLCLAGVLLIAAGVLSWHSGLSLSRTVAGVGIGALIPTGWYLSGALSQQVFEPIQPDSLSFMRPLANTINFGLTGGSEEFLSMDIGLMVGTVAGAFVVAVLTRRFRIETFATPDAAPISRYVVGGVMMGFGGVLAAGCTVGAGFSGVSLLAISALVGLVSMLLGAALTDRLLVQSRPLIVAAE